MSRIGILGVGHLAKQMVRGWMRLPDQRPEIIISPRNREISESLAAEFGVRIAANNDELVEAADIIFLACRPAQAFEAVTGLPWRKDQYLVSVCAGVTVEALSAGIAAKVHRAMPITASSIGESPTLLYPDNPVIREAMQSLGPVIAVPAETDFETATVNAAVYGWVFAVIDEMSRWCEAQGLDPAIARHSTAHSFRAATGMILKNPGEPLSVMLEELATPGGITELGLKDLESARALEAWPAAAEKVLARLRGET